MKIVTSVAKMQELSRQARGAGLTVGFVPTMGYLHEGHLALVAQARGLADFVVVSIFVNPTQFNNAADFESYPVDHKTDEALLESENVDVLFRPSADEVYRPGAATRVSVEGLTTGLCGAHRPGHFEGVTTVVSALFNMVLPDFAVFGQKDFQQLQVVRQMTRDLHFPVKILSVPTLRERDGVAMSSRNARLTREERLEAPVIHRAHGAARDAFAAGEREASKLIAVARGVLDGCDALEVEYLEVVDGETLAATEVAADGAVVAFAGEMGRVRLIDNVILTAELPRGRAAARPSSSSEGSSSIQGVEPHA